METNDDNAVELRKIPLEGFISVLQDLYDKGADFVDIVAKPNENQDEICLIVREEYIDPENNCFDEELTVYPKDIPLSNINPEDLV